MRTMMPHLIMEMMSYIINDLITIDGCLFIM